MNAAIINYLLIMIQEIDITDSIISTSSNILEAIAAIDETLARTAIVIDKYQKVEGTVTDGDVRRHLLGNGDLHDKVTSIMNKNFVFADQSFSRKQCSDKMVANNIRQLPILNNQGVLERLYILKSQYQYRQNQTNTVVIMAGGKGTRLRPATLKTPKPLIEVGGSSMIEIIINNCKKYGLSNFIICVNYLKEQIISALGDGNHLGVTINYIEEETELGTAGALSLIEDELKFPLIVMNADVLTKVNFQELLEFHSGSAGDAAICTRFHSTTVPFGVIESSGGKVISIVEKPEFISEVNAGIYVISPKLLSEIKYNEYLDMPDFIQMLIKQNKGVNCFPVHEYWIDVGQHHTLEAARQEWSGG